MYTGFGFHFRLPYSESVLYKDFITKHGMLTKHKGWEMQGSITHWTDILNLDVGFTTKMDHAGFRLDITILGIFFGFSIYDGRHWDIKNSRWEETEKV